MEMYIILFFLSMALTIYVLYRMENKEILKEKRANNVNKFNVEKVTSEITDAIEGQASFAKKTKDNDVVFPGWNQTNLWSIYDIMYYLCNNIAYCSVRIA